MTRKLRLGILGTGNIARQFCSGAQQAQRVELTAVGSRSRESAAAFADQFAIPNRYDRYEALLGDDELDAIYLTLPNALHAEWTIKALEAGKHVLCEKPLAVSTSQAEEMFAAAERCERNLVEAFMYRSHPLLPAIKDAIEAGRIGELRAIRANFCFHISEPGDNVRFQSKLAGGALMDVGVYCINFSRFLTGEEPDQIKAVGETHESGVDGLVGGCLRFPSGVVSVFLCGLTAHNDNTVIVAGSEGYLEIPFTWKPGQNACFRIIRQKPPLTDRKTGQGPALAPAPEEISVTTTNSLYGQEADDFAATVLDSEPPVISPADSLGNMAVVDEIARQIRGE